MLLLALAMTKATPGHIARRCWSPRKALDAAIEAVRGATT